MYKQLTKANKKKQLDRINSKVWTKGDILAFGKLLNSMRFSGEARKKQTYELYDLLNDRIENSGYAITKEQSEFGIQWLRELVFTKTGKARRSKASDSFTEEDLEVIRNFKRFEFVGFHEDWTGYNSRYTPIYRCIGKDGAYFDYYAFHWEKTEVVNRGKYHEMKGTKLYEALNGALDTNSQAM